MKRLMVCLVALMVVAMGVSAANAAPYFTGNIGMVMLEDSDVTEAGGSGEMSFDDGFGLTLGLGNAYGNGFRSEVEFGYRTNDTDELSVSGYGSIPIGGDITTVSLMANVLYDFVPEGNVSPFIGVGLGIANIEADLDYLESADDNVFAGQLMAGVGFAVSPNVKLDVQYRYFVTEDPDFDGTEGEYATHNALVGLRYSF